MQTIEQRYIINAPIAQVWQALVDPKIIEKWGAGPAKMDDNTGVKFSLWGGSIWGKNIKVIKEKVLSQEWYSDEDPKWKQPSMVTFKLHTENKGTVIELVHSNIPDANAKDIEAGWKDYYLGALKAYVEEKA